MMKYMQPLINFLFRNNASVTDLIGICLSFLAIVYGHWPLAILIFLVTAFIDTIGKTFIK